MSLWIENNIFHGALLCETLGVPRLLLQQHGLPADALQVIFQAIVINKLSYASPAWWGFSSADDQNCLEAFL